MAVSPLELLRRQAESTVHREVNRQVSQVRRQTSLVTQVQQMSRKAGEKLNQAADDWAREARRPEEAGELLPDEEARPAVTCADGYVRRSPVQRYRRPRVKRWRGRLIRWCAALILGIALALLVWRSNLLQMFF